MIYKSFSTYIQLNTIERPIIYCIYCLLVLKYRLYSEFDACDMFQNVVTEAAKVCAEKKTLCVEYSTGKHTNS